MQLYATSRDGLVWDKPALGAYIERYGVEFGVAPLSEFGASVTSVAPAAGGGDAWEVRWTRGGDETTDTFDAVVVANGHYEEPYEPSLPGEAEWLEADAARTIVHSRRYDDPAEFRGRSVLVVGGRSSGEHGHRSARLSVRVHVRCTCSRSAHFPPARAGVDISRALRGEAAWVYVLEKKCEAPISHEGEVSLTRVRGRGRVRVTLGFG